jgi:recombination protein RecT
MSPMSVNMPVVITEVSKVLRSEDVQRQVKSLLPPSVTPDRFTEVTITAIQNNPDVLEADRDSLYRACLSSARRGLLPDKREGALVIYNTNVGTRDQPRWMKMVQFLPMVEGIIKEMAKAGIKAYAVSVYENDSISFWNDDEGQHVRHEPVVFGDRGKIVGFYAAAMAEGRPYVEAMSLEDVAQVARRSKQNNTDKSTGQILYGGTWKTDFDRMGQKSALHRLRKRLPITDEDALENLKDMEEASDIDLSTTAASSPVAAAPAPQAESSSPPPEQKVEQQALPPPQENPLKNKLRTPRKSRVLEGVVAQERARAAVASHQQQQPPATKAQAPQAQTRSAPPQQQPEPEYSEDDIV